MVKKIKLRQPDRSGPSEKTLLQIAEERGLFAQADQKEKENGDASRKRALPKSATRVRVRQEEDEEQDDDALSPTAERVLETMLWTVSLAMLHFTLDVLVQHQYSIDQVQWPQVCIRAVQALMVFALLFYPLHPHASNPRILPGLPQRFQSAFRQAVFFATSLAAGCHLIHVTNHHGYLAVMKRAPPLGCLWVWSVIELDLPLAALSLAGAGVFVWAGGYSIK